MKSFMDENFLLSSETARSLWHDHAKNMPIFDYHCHLLPAEIATNKRYSNITELWLGADHYKWRAMRTMGQPETHITGDADPKEKFMAWAATVERLIGNPLYHWTHLELQRYFDIYRPLTRATAEGIWEEANSRLSDTGLSIPGILKKFNVYAVGTTDDPVDSLEHHLAIRAGTSAVGKIDTKVLPSFRPDRALKIEAADFPSYIRNLENASGIFIKSVEDLKAALDQRLSFFVAAGCVASDHALEYAPCNRIDGTGLETLFTRRMNGEVLNVQEADAFRTELLIHLAGSYAEKGVAMQIHLAAIRNNNARMAGRIGPDTGFDASHDRPESQGLSGLLDAMDSTGPLPKLVLYSLNPKDYYPLATLMGCHQGGREAHETAVPGRTQLGSAWWFLDHRDGMEEQLRLFASTSALANFIGMLTDSRSFLSYPRHEYFRRILCNLVGGWVENGEFPADRALLGEIIEGISFKNAERWFRP